MRRFVTCILLALILMDCHPIQNRIVAIPKIAMMQNNSVDLKASVLSPVTWHLGPQKTAPFLSYAVWENDENRVAVGIGHVTMPFIASRNMLMLMLKSKYKGKGAITKEWDDAAGRHWIEAEDDKYFAHGYVLQRGHDAWIVVAGHRMNQDFSAEDFELAKHIVDEVVIGDQKAPTDPSIFTKKP